MTDKSIEEEVMIKAGQARKLAKYMSSTQDLVEEKIQKAFKKGEFENLEGAGKPLNLYENPFEPPELRMVFKILKNNDFAPYWIELGKEIDAEFDKFEKELNYFLKYTRIFVSGKHNQASIKRFETKKAKFYYESRLWLEKIAKKIIDYNLHCPTYREARPNIIVDDRMYEVITSVERIIEEHNENLKSETSDVKRKT